MSDFSAARKVLESLDYEVQETKPKKKGTLSDELLARLQKIWKEVDEEVRRTPKWNQTQRITFVEKKELLPGAQRRIFGEVLLKVDIKPMKLSDFF